ncbi:PTS sugar transporter subunit IIA [Desulforhabdus amnigena]|jgi:mannitol/fructose-specific phosphotransferase system IIA component (Ntr-type)|uniref:PTS transporter subunit IIA n=1 Tax=Desulforhabdus amnigena TaxID=40218 RepID=A0A9W6FWH1_9BACT|nr:PTS sugar transporter subunit IIA [Desulforhabdus amnigena]NLJ29479.1 PTS sugar transporter subunit IIA [Deltaproteobacteria bacterium]GLI36161.1 PTS transporter subunit IIA [Desulforhabdus amnigena]
MDSLLDALQEGRLIELLDNNKEDALQFLAHIIEAIPSLPAGTDVMERVMARERAANSALGKGWACPHTRVPFEEDLMCVVGWSPQGIDYGAPDGIPVSIIVMYLVPENQRNQFLREASMLAKALKSYADMEKLSAAGELNEIRDYLLDLISSTRECVGPDARARMIQLQVRPSVAPIPAYDLANLIVEPVTIVTGPGLKHIVLAQNRHLVEFLDSARGLVEKLATEGVFQNDGWRVLKRGEVTYQGDRILYDCLAIKTADANPKTDR